MEVITFLTSEFVFQHTWAPGEKEMIRQEVLRSIENKDNHQYWYVEDGKTIVGALGVKENSYRSGGYEMSEDYVGVHVSHRRKGIGTSLLRTMEDFVKKLEGRYILIETCDTESYKPARLFYEKHGYNKVGAIPDYYVAGEGRIDYYKPIR